MIIFILIYIAAFNLRELRASVLHGRMIVAHLNFGQRLQPYGGELFRNQRGAGHCRVVFAVEINAIKPVLSHAFWRSHKPPSPSHHPAPLPPRGF